MGSRLLGTTWKIHPKLACRSRFTKLSIRQVTWGVRFEAQDHGKVRHFVREIARYAAEQLVELGAGSLTRLVAFEALINIPIIRRSKSLLLSTS